MVRELYTDAKEIRLSKAPKNVSGTNVIMFLGDKRNKFNGETLRLTNETTGASLGTAVITKTVFKVFDKYAVGEIANYWDSNITTINLLKNAMKAKYDAAFSPETRMTLVTFTATAP
jgi:hypothetical protein